MTKTSSSPSTGSLLVACLCANWCRACKDYRAVFDAVARERQGQARFAWVDIEDHADALADTADVENFPSLLISRSDTVLFVGAVMPHRAVLDRLVGSALAGDLPDVTDLRWREWPARVRRICEATEP